MSFVRKIISEIEKGLRGERFSPLFFIINIIITGFLFGCAFKFIFPHVWEEQFRASWWSHVILIAGFSIFCCFAEWTFHRFTLHAAVVPGFKYFNTKHEHHHRITGWFFTAKGVEVDHYAIIKDVQHESAFFPWYAPAGFLVAVNLIASLLHFSWWLLGSFLVGSFGWHLPPLAFVLWGNVMALFSLTLYEILHWAFHLPDAKWLNGFKNPVWGNSLRRLYFHHKIHHLDSRTNQNVAGVWGVWMLADIVFKTRVKPEELQLQTVIRSPLVYKIPPRPRRFVIWLDMFALWVMKKRGVVVCS